MLNGDRRSVVWLVHASCASVSKASADEVRTLGLPCPPTTGNGPTVAAPATGGDETSPAKAGSSTDPVDEEILGEREAAAKGSAEEAQTKEHQMTRLPNIQIARFAPG